MSRSDDAGHYFQTTESLATTERKAAKAKNKHGDPIKLPSKILALLDNPAEKGTLYVAEAAGDVKKVVMETSKVTKLFTQAAAPITCLALCTTGKTLFAGCWDKSIYAISLQERGNPARRFTGHTDFLKCLITTSLDSKPILISGGADATIIVWDIETGKQLHKLKGHTKALQDFAIDGSQYPVDDMSEPFGKVEVFSASSDREIRRWEVSLTAAKETAESLTEPILAHETSVYRICFDGDGDLWTASADKTAKHLVRSRGWEADTVLQHPDFVRDVVVVEKAGVVITACRDEEVRVWDLGSGELVCTYSGHFEEVTGLVGTGDMVVSGSIDGSVRRWGLGRREMMTYLEEAKKEQEGTMEESEKGPQGGSQLTAEEEAELAELMDDD